MKEKEIESKEEIKVSLFKNVASKGEIIELEKILNQIKLGNYRVPIDKIRDLIKSGEDDRAQEMKRNLSAFTPSGTFKDGHAQDNLIEHSGLMVIDFDKVGDVDALRKIIQHCPYTYTCFISPTGNGVKVLVKADVLGRDHKSVFEVVANYYESMAHQKVDRSGKDVSRLCFVSYDPEIYFNPKSLSLVMDELVKQDTGQRTDVEKVSNRKEVNEKFTWCVSLIEKGDSFYEGNRNNFIHKLSCLCNRAGILEELTRRLIFEKYGNSPKGLKKTIAGVYKRNFHEFGKLQLKDRADADLKAQVHFGNYLPDLGDKLPSFLSNVTIAFTDPRERDVVLIGLMTLLSACIPRVYGKYHRRKICANLFSFIVAPPASAKGALIHVQNIGEPLHDYIRNSIINLDRNGNALTSSLFLSGNSSSAALFDSLQANNGEGIILETEATSLSKTLGREWGQFTDVLCKAFHNERATKDRKKDNERIEIKEPKFSIVLTGTPSQVKTLVPYAEDGLFSRILFYRFSEPFEWKGPELGDDIQFQQMLDTASEQLLEFYDYSINNPFKFSLTDEQNGHRNSLFIEWGKELSSDTERASLIRLAVMLFKIAMVLTALRRFENQVSGEAEFCQQVDYDSTVALITALREHMKSMIVSLNDKKELKSSKEQFEMELPTEFVTEDAYNLGDTYDLHVRTVRKYLKLLEKGGKIVRLKRGHYKRINTVKAA